MLQCAPFLVHPPSYLVLVRNTKEDVFMSDQSIQITSEITAKAPQSIPFTHLHVHTEYSLLESTCKIPELVRRAKALGYRSLAITDSDNLFGVVYFFKECERNGIRRFSAPKSMLLKNGIRWFCLRKMTKGIKTLSRSCRPNMTLEMPNCLEPISKQSGIIQRA